MSTPAPSSALAPRAQDDEIVVYSPLARKASTALAPTKAPTKEQTEVQALQQTVQNLLQQNFALRGTIVQAQQYGQMLQNQLLWTQQQLAGAQTRNLAREEHLAGIIKSVRLQLRCEQGEWEETQQLWDLDNEVDALRQFLDYQYQHERLWGADELHSPRFYYEAGGFSERRTGPNGDGGVWRKRKTEGRREVLKTMTQAMSGQAAREDGGFVMESGRGHEIK